MASMMIADNLHSSAKFHEREHCIPKASMADARDQERNKFINGNGVIRDSSPLKGVFMQSYSIENT